MNSMSERKLLKIDAHYLGKCSVCGKEDRRITYVTNSHMNGVNTMPFVWCPDCFSGHIAWWPKDIVSVEGSDVFHEQVMAIMAERDAEVAKLREEHKRYKEALELIATQCLVTFEVFESTDDTQDILDTVCDALGWDYDAKVEEAEAKGRKEFKEMDEDDDQET
jgi:hypothetical protein